MNNTTDSIGQFKVDDFNTLKTKVLNWVHRFGTFCFLDNHGYRLPHHSNECLVAAGAKRFFTSNENDGLSRLQQFLHTEPSWLFGHFNYDVKNQLERLQSRHPDKLGFPDIYFFEPEILLRFNEQQLEIEGENAQAIYRAIMQTELTPAIQIFPNQPAISSNLNRQQYLETIEKLKEHIHRGDCYEINFCVEFFAENYQADPLTLYRELSRLSPNPFSAFYRVKNSYLLCASPERYFKKTGDHILSQPIKGTSRRVPMDHQLDEESKEHLINSQKDKAENVMVVDLVRNDLSRICKEGSVHASELFGIYSFPQVHQMISTVEGILKEGVRLEEIIRASFPMGSMTGAPKKRVMELIDQYEQSRRGIFSGTVGYITPDSDADFNVVIRSIMYNANTDYLSYQVGSAITFLSNPEEEWEECQLKAEAIKKVLSVKTTL